MSPKWLSLLVIIGFVFLTVFSAVKAQGTPHYPSPVKPGNGVTITDSNSIEFCVTPNDPGESRIEVFQGPIDDFQSPWNSNNPACWTYTLPNGHYTWHTRGKNSAGEGGASPDLTFTVQVGNQQPPTRVPGPENATAVPDVGPDFSYSFNPANETNVGQGVTIHITVNCGPNCGEVDTTPSCGGGDQPVNTSGNFDYHWNTNGCNPGGASISICSKARSDQQGTRRNCKSPGYQLNGQTSPDSPVIESFTADNIATTGECTTLRWTTRNATSVVLNGQGVATTGSMQVCPKSSQQFGLRASNGRGPDATGNVVIQVNNSSVPGVSSSSNGGGPQVGPALNNQRPEDARQSGVPGGVNLINYAYAKGFSNADNSNGSANGWYLSGGPHGESWQLNSASEWAKVCFDVYGPGYTASNPQNTRDGWRCVTGNGNNSSSRNTNPQPAVPQQSTNQTNAIGQPMIVLPNGDLVYPKAEGSGGDLCVHGDINSLYLRTTPDANSKGNIIGTMTAGNCYQLIQLSNGWAQVATSLATGWVRANPEWVTVNQQTQIQPTVMVAGVKVTATSVPEGNQNAGRVGQGIVGGGTPAMKVVWSFCFGCTSSGSITFSLLAGHYDPNSFRLTVLGTNVPFDNWSIEKGLSVDTITFQVNAATIQSLLNAGFGGYKMDDVNNWRLFTSGYTYPIAPDGWGWVPMNLFNEDLASHIKLQKDLEKELSFVDWAIGQGTDKVRDYMLTVALQLVKVGKLASSLTTKFVDTTIDFAFGSRNDTKAQLADVKDRIVKLQALRADTSMRSGNYILIPWGLAEVPAYKFPLYWEIWSDYVP